MNFSTRRSGDSNPSPPPTNRRISTTFGSAAGERPTLGGNTLPGVPCRGIGEGQGGRESEGTGGLSFTGRSPPSPPTSSMAANRRVRERTGQIKEEARRNDEKGHIAGSRFPACRTRWHGMQEEGAATASDAPPGSARDARDSRDARNARNARRTARRRSSPGGEEGRRARRGQGGVEGRQGRGGVQGKE